MDFVQSDQFTQRVEQIIKNYFHITEDTPPSIKELYDKIEALQQQLIQTQFTLLQYLKSSFEALREQINLDTETMFQPRLNINPQLSQLESTQFDKNLLDKITLLTQRLDAMQLNRDELQEEIKSFDGRLILQLVRIDSQWQGLANVTDQFWAWKKELEPLLLQHQEGKKKKFALF